MNIFDKFEEKVAMSKEELLANMQSQITGMTNWANNMDKLSDMGIDQGLYQKLAEMGPQGAQYVGAFVNMTSDELAKANDLWAQSLVLPNSVANRITDKWANMGTNIPQGMADGIAKNTDAVTTEVNNMDEAGEQQGIIDWEFGSPSKNTKKWGYWLDLGLGHGITETTSVPKNAMSNMCRAVMQQAESILDSTAMYNLGASLASSAAAGLNDNMGAVQSAVASIKTAVEEAGRYVDEGLADGIKENKKEPLKEGKKLAQDTTESVKDEFKQRSPSKVFYEIGKFLDMGLANGIRDYTGLVINNTDAMAEEAISAMRYTVATIAATIQDGVDDPVITPVLDLSKVNSGIRTLNSTFSSQQALNAAGSISNLQNGQLNGGVNFIQNNYSPKALSRTEIYRQTNNQLTMLRRVATGG